MGGKGSGARIGNQNARTYTTEKMEEILDKMEAYVNEGECVYIGWLLSEFNFHPDWWHHRKTDHKGAIASRMNRIEQKMEKNLVSAMLKGKVKETTGIFTLKSKHKWVDKHQVEHNVNPIQINLNLAD